KAQEMSEELGQIHLLSRLVKSGLGGAYRAGFTWGLEHDYEYFVEIDCDFSHDPRALPAMLVAATTHEVVIGSRYIKDGTIPKWLLSRRLLSRGGHQYASIIKVPISLTDRAHGESKMSRAIVLEALWLVTKWAVERPLLRLNR